MKAKVTVLLLPLFFSGCATLNSALESANSILGGVNDGLSAATGAIGGTLAGDKVYNVGTKTTADYSISNFKVTVTGISKYNRNTPATGFSGRAGLMFTGIVKNKTARTISISFSVPIYDKDGHYLRSVSSSTSVPANETAKLYKEELGMIDWGSGERPNVQKMTIKSRKL